MTAAIRTLYTVYIDCSGVPWEIFGYKGDSVVAVVGRASGCACAGRYCTVVLVVGCFYVFILSDF